MRTHIIYLVLTVLAAQASAVAGESSHGPNIECQDLAEIYPIDDEKLREAMKRAAARDDWPEIRAFVWEGADPEIIASSAWYSQAVHERLNAILVSAAVAGDDELLVETIEKGADINFRAQTLHYMSPLIWAAACDHISTVNLLLNRGAHVNISSGYYNGPAGGTEGNTPLIWAAYYANDDVVTLLLERGADPNAQEVVIRGLRTGPIEKKIWDTPLLASGSANTTDILLRFGANPNRVRSDGTSPLMEAASWANNADQCKVLLAHGADPTLKNADGLTAADLARAFKHPKIAEIIDNWR